MSPQTNNALQTCACARYLHSPFSVDFQCWTGDTCLWCCVLNCRLLRLLMWMQSWLLDFIRKRLILPAAALGMFLSGICLLCHTVSWQQLYFVLYHVITIANTSVMQHLTTCCMHSTVNLATAPVTVNRPHQ